MTRSLSPATMSNTKSQLAQWVRGPTMLFRQRCLKPFIDRLCYQDAPVLPSRSTSQPMSVTVMLNSPLITWQLTRRTHCTMRSAKVTIHALRLGALPIGKCYIAPQCSSKVKSRMTPSLETRALLEQHKNLLLRGLPSQRFLIKVVRTLKFACKK